MHRLEAVKAIVRWVFGALFVGAGVLHFIGSAFFISIVPPYLPYPAALVYVSGVAEIALGGLLWLRPTSRLAAWGLIALLIAVFPANLHMALHAERYPEISPVALLIRLPLQGVLIGVAYWLTRARLTGAPSVENRQGAGDCARLTGATGSPSIPIEKPPSASRSMSSSMAAAVAVPGATLRSIRVAGGSRRRDV